MTLRLSSFHDDFLSDFVRFMEDCDFSAAAAVVPFNVVLALQATYRPHRDFWRSLDVPTVLAGLSRCVPTLNAVIANTRRHLYSQLVDEIEGFLTMNAFDEANAEQILTLPPEARPQDAESAYAWICAHHAALGAREQLRYAHRDGVRCGEAALDLVEGIEASAAGRGHTRLGSEIAELVRTAAIKRRTRSGVSDCEPARA